MSGTLRGRRALTIGALGAVAILVAGCAGGGGNGADNGDGGDNGDGPAISGQVIWADYGGPTNESREIAYFEGFYDDTDVEVISSPIEDAIYYSMLEGKDGDYDIFQVSMRDVLGYPDHMLELPAEAQGDLVPENLRPHVAAGFIIGMAQGWLADTFDDGGPQNWEDFFDLEKYPGKRAWPGAPSFFDSSYEIALLADGVAVEDLYPIDVERAITKLDSIRDSLIFYQSYAEVQQLLSSESAAIAVTVTGQFTALQNAGHDVTIQWNEAFSSLQGFVIPEKANNPDAALALATWINDPVNQAAFAERTLYGPVNSEVFDVLPADVASQVVNSPEHEELIIPWNEQWRAENADLLRDSYAEWLEG